MKRKRPSLISSMLTDFSKRIGVNFTHWQQYITRFNTSFSVCIEVNKKKIANIATFLKLKTSDRHTTIFYDETVQFTF